MPTLIPQECKRLAEVDFPVAAVSRHSAREKSIRHGHPSTLHLWWARRPLAACRAMLLALLLPDPCDPACPAAFKEQARILLAPIPEASPTSADDSLRRALLKLIADFANWDLSASPTYLECARGLVRAAHGDESPLVVDPFAGGGSIPLEALRLGCDAFASDLNPVACLILKVLLEDIPRQVPQLAEELRRAGAEIKAQAEKEIGEFYPPDPGGATPIAYLWARTVRCEAAGCGAEIPLLRSRWLCKKAKRRRALGIAVTRARPEGGPAARAPRVEFEIFEPKSEAEVGGGTVNRAKATCPACHIVLPPERVRAQLAAQRGGADVVFDDKGRRIGGARLLAVVTLKEGQTGRQYRPPTDADYAAVHAAAERLKIVAAQKLPSGLSPVPDEPLPPIGTLGFRVQRYGMLQWGDLFTARQKLALVTLAGPGAQRGDSARAAAAVAGRCADYWSSLCGWHQSSQKINHTFTRQALPVVWDFAEATPLAGASGGLEGALGWVCGVAAAGPLGAAGRAEPGDARHSPLPSATAGVWFTDPPYYDAVPYADLSDFFLVWLRRALPDEPLLQNRFEPGSALSPKGPEIVQDETKTAGDGRKKDKAYFESAMGEAFAEGRRVLAEDGIGCVVFAHKTTEGWEALISGLLAARWTVTASWPITTEMATRLRARDSAALAASVHLVCRPRAADAGTGGWEEIVTALPDRIGDWMERLAREGIRGADLVFSCIGPALELYSRYDRVETASGADVSLADFLAKVWEVVGRTALEQVLGTAEARARNGAAGALEEDARLTALFLWTLEATDPAVQPSKVAQASSPADSEAEVDAEGKEDEEEDAKPAKAKKGLILVFDVVRRFAQPLGIHLENWEGRVIETKKGTVRLLPVLEREAELFGAAGARQAAVALAMPGRGSPQLQLFPEPAEPARPRRAAAKPARPVPARREPTTLDQVHAAMILQARGHAAALRAHLADQMRRSPDFLRLANALSSLYPKDSEDKRLLDAMLLAVRR